MLKHSGKNNTIKVAQTLFLACVSVRMTDYTPVKPDSRATKKLSHILLMTRKTSFQLETTEMRRILARP